MTGVVIETCIKCLVGRNGTQVTDMQRPFPNGHRHRCPFGCNGRGRWPKAMALFWCQNVYLVLSQFYKYTWLTQRGRNLNYVTDGKRSPLCAFYYYILNTFSVSTALECIQQRGEMGFGTVCGRCVLQRVLSHAAQCSKSGAATNNSSQQVANIY